jgi:enoyl-CoA hydratase/carnithine racemase
MTAPLRIVQDRTPTLSERIKALQAEARGLAREHVGALQAILSEVERLAKEIAEGGEAYPAGVRDLARRLAEDTANKAQTIEAISGRNA